MYSACCNLHFSLGICYEFQTNFVSCFPEFQCGRGIHFHRPGHDVSSAVYVYIYKRLRVIYLSCNLVSFGLE